MYLLQSLDQIEIRKQARVSVNIGPAVRAQNDVADFTKSGRVLRVHFFEKLPLAGCDVQPINLHGDPVPLDRVDELRVRGPGEILSRQQTGDLARCTSIQWIEPALFACNIFGRKPLPIRRGKAPRHSLGSYRAWLAAVDVLYETLRLVSVLFP